jgi:hypothetical protein
MRRFDGEDLTGAEFREGTVLDEEWAHHGFCVRDLDKLSSQAAP